MTALELMKEIKDAPTRTTCKHGHPWIKRNIYAYKDTRRGTYCKICAAASCRKWHATRRMAA